MNCGGLEAAARVARGREAAAAVLTLWQDAAPTGKQPARSLTVADVGRYSSFVTWLKEPLGYSSTGATRCVQSARTLSVLQEVGCPAHISVTVVVQRLVSQDITFLLRNAPLDSKLDLAILCDEDTVRHILTSAINAGAKGASRMYNLVSAIEKVVSFMTSVYKLEATSLFLVRTLMTQYNKMRHRNGPKTVAITKSQLLLLASRLEDELNSPVPITCNRACAFRFMSYLLVSFLTFILPQRSQVGVLW